MHFFALEFFCATLCGLVVALVLGLVSSSAVSAAPSDMRVLTDDISAPGEVGLEFQTSVAKPAINDSLGQGTVWQGLIEPTYGISNQWEASLQFPVERLNGTWYGTGLNSELQYVAPHDETEGFYYGGRAEINYVTPAGSQKSWQTEWRVILGYRVDAWHLVLNPSITVPIAGAERRVTFEPSAKLLHRFNQQSDIGLEYFVQAGPIADMLPSQQRYELAMLVLDTKIGKSDFNIGAGKALNNATDRWVIKAILSFSFGT